MPIAVVYKVTWDDEKIIVGTLKDIVEKVQGRYYKLAQILVGDFIEGEYEDQNCIILLFPMDIGRVIDENCLYILYSREEEIGKIG